MPYTYILRCSDGTYYTGSAVDLERRLAQHQAGKGAKYTRQRLPVRLVYCEEYRSIGDAFRREKQVQSWSRAKKQALIEGRADDLPRLARKVFGKS
jgi:putative endonuclease